MKPMELLFRILFMIGLDPFYLTDFPYYCVIIIYYINILLTDIIPGITFIQYNRNNILLVTSAIPIVVTTLVSMVKISLHIVHRQYIIQNYNNLLSLINSANTNTNQHYLNAEAKAKTVTKTYLVIVILDFVAYIAPPGFMQYLNYLNSEPDEMIYKEPFNHVYFYNTETPPFYQIFYILTFISTIVMGLGFMCVDLFLFIGCIYVYYMFKHLQDLIEEMNNTVGEVEDRQNKFKNCITFHTEIINFIDELQKLYSVIIFFHFVSCTLTICTAALQLIMFHNRSVDIAKNFLFVITQIINMFLYSFFGTLITSQSEDIGKSIYFCDWYNFNNIERKYLILMLQRSQKTCNITGMNLFPCNLQTFMSILEPCYSGIALLYNLSFITK